MTAGSSSGGTGSRLARAVVIVAGVSALVASMLSLLSIWLQTKNYRKPLLQRYVVRILLMVPIYAVASWSSIVSRRASLWLDPIRDVYEAFTIYTFFQLLINFLGGERALIIMTHGRPPVSHAWPLNHFLPKVDISDPHTFLAVKRGILQYTWLKPILAIASIIMKATDTYQEGYLGLESGYLWTGIVYNVSVTVSLYSLAMFWVCLHDDLSPFRPVPKFLCVKLIIFASYWQGFFLSILQWLGALSNGVAGYTPDNLAAAIQDTLICFEMPIFAITHWYAFSWHDYADPTISAARLPVVYALRDAFGAKDLVEDTKMTLRGENYEYRLFDSGDHIIPHAESNSRVKRVMDGMRYERGGKAKYWIPKPGEVNSRTPLLADAESSNRSRRSSALERFRSNSDIEETTLDPDDEELFTKARALEFGDWNYPVITANIVPRDQRLPSTTTYQNVEQAAEPVKRAPKHRKSRTMSAKNEQRDNRNGSSHSRRKGSHESPSLKRGSSSLTSQGSHRSQLVDLVVEDREAEEEERAQVQRAFGSTTVEPETKHFQRPSGKPVDEENHTAPPAEGGGTSNENTEAVKESEESEEESRTPVWSYGGLEEENVWGK
ncbi:transmembrane protein 184 homolog C30D11.06c [Aspergillus udagawae]|nr:transmembrane protein 184 homolog C30D11.06c [Aspergillus udagawae]